MLRWCLASWVKVKWQTAGYSPSPVDLDTYVGSGTVFHLWAAFLGADGAHNGYTGRRDGSSREAEEAE